MLWILACGPPTVGTLDLGDPEPEASWEDPAPGAEGVGGLPTVDVFSPEAIHAFRLELSSSARSQLRWDPFDYVEATFVVDDFEYEVGVRIKGSSTYQSIDDKPSLKLSFDHVHEGLHFQGMRRINLHNMVLDPMLSSEVLSWGLFRAAELPAPRVGYARLDIDGDDRGLYSVVEDIEDAFLERWFEDPDGNLYENRENYCDVTSLGCFDVEEDDEGDHAALEALIEDADLEGEAWLEAMRGHMDWERFVGFLAMERSVAHWDSYSFDLSNYRLYHDPSAGFSFVPWSGDLGFGYRPWSHPDCGRHGEDPAGYDMGRLASRCQAVPACREAVLDAMLEQADLLEEVDAAAQVPLALDRVRAEAETDPVARWDMDHFEEHGACVEAFLEDRPEALRAFVDAER